MPDFKFVSRRDLYGDEIGSERERENVTYNETLPLIELEIVEVQEKEDDLTNDQNDEFDFPLFSSSKIETAEVTGVENEVVDKDHESASNVKLMKVSLHDLPILTPKQVRPKNYYFSENTGEELLKFTASAIDPDLILKESKLGPNQGWEKFRGKHIDADKYNKEVESVLLRERILKKRRPGKKQRLARKLGAERELERETKAKEIKKMMKKKFHKRGGKKTKKTSINPLKNAGARPRFRPE